MKYMFASDIHGSAYYCRKMLEAYEKEGAKRLVLLGDLLYHGPRNDLPREYAPKEVDLSKVIPMVLIHDLVEIDAGDTYAYDDDGAKTKRAREKKGADRIFGLLPEDQGKWLYDLWEEFEAYETPEAKYAHMLDNSQPLFLNDATDGISWVEHGVKKSQIYKRNSRTGEGAPKIWEYMQELIDKHVEKGHVIGDI